MTTEDPYQALTQANTDFRSALAMQIPECQQEALQDSFRAYWPLMQHDDQAVRGFAERFHILWGQAADVILWP